jgi:hypothetical protein
MNIPETLTGIVERQATPDSAGELLTFLGWKERGRHVRSGERGVKVPAWREADGLSANVEKLRAQRPNDGQGLSPRSDGRRWRRGQNGRELTLTTGAAPATTRYWQRFSFRRAAWQNCSPIYLYPRWVGRKSVRTTCVHSDGNKRHAYDA